jgi:hypothetical protein
MASGIDVQLAAIKTVVDAIRSKTDTIGVATLTVTAPAIDGEDIEIVSGDDYSGTRAIAFSVADWAGDNLNTATGFFRMIRSRKWAGSSTDADLEVAVTYAQSGTTVTTTITLTAQQTAELDTVPPSDSWNYRWQLTATVGGKAVTVGGATANSDTGRCRVAKRIL